MSVNKLILEQLEKVKSAKISNYDEFKHSYFISKYNEVDFQVNHCYLIKLNDVLLRSDSIYASNWNNGSHPTRNYMKVDVSKKLGDMIYINGLYYNMDTQQDINEMWSGWLSTKELELLKEI